MDTIIAIVGFGEAGQAFAEGWKLGHEHLRAYDVAIHDSERAPAMRAAFGTMSVAGFEAVGDTIRGAAAVFCFVPTDQAVAAAEAAALLLDQGTLWIDGSSSAPSTKRRASEIVAKGRGHYVDMAIMAPVHPKLHKTPVLLSGDHAEAAWQVTSALDMDARVVGNSIGDASTVKMLRSIIVKGMEALSAECFLAARRAGIEELVFNSLQASGEASDWPRRTTYNMGRMTGHGGRRAAEMREVATTLNDLGMPHWMASATALWQDRLAGLPISEDSNDTATCLDSVLAALK